MSFFRNAFKSWKTTLAGLVPVAYVVLPLLGVALPPGTLEVVLGAVGVGLLNAKDADVTGGKKPQ